MITMLTKKRTVALLLVLATLVASVLTACGEKPNDDPAETTAAVTEKTDEGDENMGNNKDDLKAEVDTDVIPRIKKLDIFGTDISEYVIEYPAENNENMLFAVSELKQLVRKACGVVLKSNVGDSGKEHVIEFRFTDDAALGDDGYRYYNDNGTLVLEGAEKRGCMNAVYRFLQNECGWDQLIGGDSYLNESDLVSISADIDKSETPAFDFLEIYGQLWEKFKTDRTEIKLTSAENSYGPVDKACHGLNKFLDATSRHPCYNQERFYNRTRDRVEAYIKEQLDSGKVIGVDFLQVDISQPDSGDYCGCDVCDELYKSEGKTHAASVIMFANRLSEELNEKYPGLVYNVFAYNGTNKPPKTVVPNEHVHITFCFDMNCSNHPLDGSECGEKGRTDLGRKNSDYAEWLEGWADITDNLYVWFYALDINFYDYTVIDTVYKDFTYLTKLGVKGVFYESEYRGFSPKRIEHQLFYELNWNKDMTEDEYYALYEKLLAKEYGNGWENVNEYLDIMNAAQDAEDCWDCWGWLYPNMSGGKVFSTDYYAENFDRIVTLMDAAIAAAKTEDEIKRCEMLMITALYKGCYSEYFKAYEADDTERIAVLSERFDRAMEYMKKYGFTLEDGIGTYISVDGYKCEFRCDSIEDAAWIDWVACRKDICPGYKKPKPEAYA